ncbi:hypothetical protein SPFL3102_03584 [Sporomusaceae bacterium FL31]|nr:hypothetical protein SPFL3101_00421 [Sporomusaceae bacterium FL31]GCE35733.1 hypothetical protein SPFL3102_03584 [Sporomusaceae bacterium]
MANNVENAIGTQRQFTPNPQGTYEKRLQAPTFRPSSAGTQGSQLAAALGLFGNAVMAEGQSKLERDQKYGVAEATRISRGTTEDDMKKLTSIDILQTYGDKALSENPWAVATVEKMKGTYFGARAKDEYNALRQSEEPAKTADEEVTRFNKFHQEYFGKNAENATDLTAFRAGFFDNHLADQAEFAAKRSGELEVERKGIAQGSVQASLGEIVAKAPTLHQEDLVKQVSDTFADTRLLGFSIPERVKLAREMAIDLAQSTGDYGSIEALGKNVVIGSRPDGTKVMLGEVLNTHDVQQLAEQKTSQLFGAGVQDSITKLQGMTKEEVNATYEKWRVENPHWFNVMSPFRDNIFHYQTQMEQKKLAATFAQAEQQYVVSQSSSILNNQLRAYLAGSTKDGAGHVVAASFGDLPKIKYQHRNSSGILEEKSKTLDSEDVNMFVDSELQKIMSNTQWDSQRKTAEAMKLLKWGPAKSYTDSVKMQLNNAIDTMTVDKLPLGDDGKARLSDQLQSAVQMYNTNPEDFYEMMGSEVTHKLEAVQLLSQANGGDIKTAIGLYAQGRDRAKDKEFTKVTDMSIMDRLASTSLSGFMDLQGNSVDVKVSAAGNRSVMERVEGLAKWLAYAGTDPAEAVEQAKATAQKTHYIWKDTAVPRSIFNGINSPQRVQVGQQVLDYYYGKYLKDTGVDPQFVTTTYDNKRGVFRITGGGGYVTYSLNDIAYSGNYILEHPPETPQGVSLADILKAREVPEMDWQQAIGLP